MTAQPLILITNDDGISAKGIRSMVEAVEGLGQIIVIAPDSPQSGMGHAITIHEPIRLYPSDIHGDIESYSCSGTPVDCVKLAVYEVLHRKPDLILSGVNHGANTSTNVLYSGTMSAAVEGAMEGIPSMGVSLCSFDSDANFENAKRVVRELAKKLLNDPIEKGYCLNVNVPDVSEADFQGVKVCRQAHAFWEDRFDKRKDQFGNPYYWLTGDFLDQDKTEDTDLFWIEKNYATIVPTQFDMTAYWVLDKLKNWHL